MPRVSDPTYLLTEQYRDGSRIGARIELHARFSTSRYEWFLWVFDQLHLPAQCRLLELGCGPGDLWRKNAGRIPIGWDISLSDFSEGMLERARQDLRACHHVFHFHIINAMALPFSGSSFDCVVANHMLYHVPQRATALAEIRRVLKPMGRLFATTVGEKHLHELTQLASTFDPKLTSIFDSEKNEFTLESGVGQLAKWFPNVIMRRFEDSLFVTEAAPLVNYVLSGVRLGVGELRRREFTEFVEHELAESGGGIHITKDSGMFECY